jgi:alpha-1,6-mannosyltransferase
MTDRGWTHSALPDVLLYAICLLYIALAPYTKVEESFNVQACHDLLEHGWQRLSLFDHLVFSGVVPRTFIGPILLTLPLRPIYWLLRHVTGSQPLVGLYLGSYMEEG